LSTAATPAAAFDEAAIAALRHQVFAEGLVAPSGMEALYAALARTGDEAPAAWQDLLSDALVSYALDQSIPAGYVSDALANRLFDRLSAGRARLSKPAFEALVSMIGLARAVPDHLAAFALAQLQASIIPPGSAPRAITGPDVEDLRRILYACSSEGFGFVTRSEAEVLFDLADLTAGQSNVPAFADLFARAIGNHLLGVKRHASPEVREALRRERWLDERQSLSGGLRRVFSRALTCVISGDGFVDAAGGWLAQGAADAVLDHALAPGEMIDVEEAAWLRERLARSDPSNPAIVALRAFLQGEPGADLALAKVA
jgi:hypothetical protein